MMEKPLLLSEAGIEGEEEGQDEEKTKESWPLIVIVMFRMMNVLGIWFDEDLEELDREFALVKEEATLEDIPLFDHEWVQQVKGVHKIRIGVMDWQWVKRMKPQGEGAVLVAKGLWTVLVIVSMTASVPSL
eukprot:TRINITY_DN2043_c0_g2_i1.p2 TRINITY_DN2043_c0_g2~~TRINITY_DN2043_c0_g2_i1.p2  ORF type:complete len:131 (+),score=38.81 TRINITY_DN2043_c0_g2_i1:129-521(+)